MAARRAAGPSELSGSQSNSPVGRSAAKRLAVAVVTMALLIVAARASVPLTGGDALLAAAPPPGTDPSLVVPPAAAPSGPASATVSASPSPRPVQSQPPQKKKKKKAKPITVPATGPGTYVKARTGIEPASSRGTLKRYDVRVEKGLDIDPQQAARLIESVLNDKRSWRGTGRWRFELVPAGERADLHAYIVTPGTTDKLCAPLLTRGQVSCQNGNRVVLNAKRWVRGAPAYGKDVTNYRRYLINHEFGHALGHNHVRCPGKGRSAPVMMQQTKGLAGCRKNPWPQSRGD